MRVRIVRVVLVALFALPLLAPAIAAAQPPPPATSVQPGARVPIGFRGYGFYETVSLSASDSFEAIFGDATASGLGLGVEGLHLWRGVFARFAFNRLTKKDGERVILIEPGGQLFPTGIATEISLTPIEFGLGWRQPLEAFNRYVAYGGFSGLRVRFSQKSQFAATGDDVSDTYGGYAVFGGFDALIARGAFLGVEVQYRSVPDTIGLLEEDVLGSVASFYGEHDLGGTVFRVLFGLRR